MVVDRTVHVTSLDRRVRSFVPPASCLLPLDHSSFVSRENEAGRDGQDDVCAQLRAKKAEVENRELGPSRKGGGAAIPCHLASLSRIRIAMAAFRAEDYDPRYAQVADEVRHCFNRSGRVEFESEACGGGACGTLFRVRNNGKRLAVKVVLEAFFDDGSGTRPALETRADAPDVPATGGGDGGEDYNSDEDGGWVDDDGVDDKLGQIQNEYFWLGVRRRPARPKPPF